MTSKTPKEERKVEWLELEKVDNPFHSTTPQGCVDTLKIIFFTVTGLALVRMLLLVLLLLFMWVFAIFGRCCGCTRAMTYPIRALIRILLFVCGFYWISYTDRRQKPYKGNIIVCNHISIWYGEPGGPQACLVS